MWRKMKKITVPKKLYHAAPECVLIDIQTGGLKSNFGQIYAASTPADAMNFMWFRILDHPHYEFENGKIVGMHLERHDRIYVFEISTNRTNLDCWDVGTDHSPVFFSGESWVYAGKNIERRAISDVTYFTREMIDAARSDVKI
jgi:hypothetical protein